MGLLDTASEGSRLASSLGGEGLARSLAAGRLASSLLGPGTTATHAWTCGWMIVVDQTIIKTIGFAQDMPINLVFLPLYGTRKIHKTEKILRELKFHGTIK